MGRKIAAVGENHMFDSSNGVSAYKALLPSSLDNLPTEIGNLAVGPEFSQQFHAQDSSHAFRGNPPYSVIIVLG